MTESEQSPAELKPLAERPPFAGFLSRLGAFFIDCILLYYIFKGLDRAARPTLLALNPLLPYLGHGLVFLYFWIGYGPLAKGRTAGKALLGIQVAGRDGGPINWGAAAKRALIQHGVFAVFLLFQMVSYMLVMPPDLGFVAYATLIVLSAMGFTLLLALSVSVIMHPRKLGWHDLWAGSYVTGTPIPFSFRRALDTPPDVVTERKMANHLRITLFFWAIVTAVILVGPFKAIFNREQRGEAEKMIVMQKQLDSPIYRFMNVSLPGPAIERAVLEQIAHDRQQALEQNQTVPTTATLRSKYPDYEAIMSAFFRKHGSYSPDDLKAPAFRSLMEEARHDLWQLWLKSPDKAAGDPQARVFEANLFEPLTLVMYSGRQLRGRVHGTADPAQGSLIFENVLPTNPQTSDRQTTSTASPEAQPPHETPRP